MWYCNLLRLLFHCFSLYLFFIANGFTATHSDSRRFHEPAKSLYLSLFTQYHLGAASSISPAQCKSPLRAASRSPGDAFTGGLSYISIRLQGSLVDAIILPCLLSCSKRCSVGFQIADLYWFA